MLKAIWIGLFTAFCIYTGWVYLYCDTKSASQLVDTSITHGQTIWQEKNCQSCHQLYGLGGYMGPDLTNIAGDSGRGPRYMYTFLKYGTENMPDYHLTENEISDIIAFLSWVDKSGTSQVPLKNIHWTGTYIIDE
ncbi:MAG: cytochrome c [Chitinophagaceae bacterium]|nr:cytochrome c [Chitinophagaceae bacterium]MCB0700660.1 cytochrome c [Chitinophagaceae bacterium]